MQSGLDVEKAYYINTKYNNLRTLLKFNIFIIEFVLGAIKSNLS